MAIDAANQTGGVDGRPLTVLEPPASEVSFAAAERVNQALVDGGAAVTIGPETTELLGVLRSTTVARQTVMLPSFATSGVLYFKPDSWFEIGPPRSRFACELMSRLQADGHDSPLLIVGFDSFNKNFSL